MSLYVLRDHRRDVMDYMNKERKKHNLCDVKLVVGEEVLYAHKSVLAAESEYFRTMFHSQFSDSDKNEIDLTLAVNNVEDLEYVVNFIYTCEIKITCENLQELVKLASFFLMKSLCEKLREYMMKKLYKDTCMQYYFCAKAAGFSDVEGMASVMLKAWFHDNHIDMDETLDITPDDLKDFEEKGFLKMCEVTQMMDFIAKWVGRHHTEKHVTVAYHVLTAFMTSRYNSSPKTFLKKKQAKKSLTRMLPKLKDAGLNPSDNKGVAEFVETFQNMLDKEVASSAVKNSSSTDGNTSTRKRKRKSPDKIQNEMVLIALGRLRDEDNDDDVDDEFGLGWHGKPLNVCIYVPSTRCWLRYCKVPVHNVALASDFYEEEKIVDFFMFSDYIFTYSYEEHSLFFYHHKGKSSSFLTKITGKESSRYGALLDRFFTIHSDTLYMVNRCLQYESHRESSLDEVHQQKVQLIGYRLDENLKFVKLFATGPVSVTGGFEYDKDCGSVRDTQIRISSKTNEMLIIHSTFDEISPASSVIFLVKLRAKNCPVKVLLNTNNEKKLTRECHIVEMDDRFLIVCNDLDRTQVICEYIFLSEQISYDTGYTPGENLYDSNNTNVYPNTTTINGTNCFWQLEVYLQKLCSLKSADFSKNQMTVTEHTSAPFSMILSAHEARLPDSFLKTLQKLL